MADKFCDIVKDINNNKYPEIKTWNAEVATKATEANASADKAKISEDKAEAAKTVVVDLAGKVTVSEFNAKKSESESAKSAQDAKNAKDEATNAETEAKASELKAKASADKAEQIVNDGKTEIDKKISDNDIHMKDVFDATLKDMNDKYLGTHLQRTCTNGVLEGRKLVDGESLIILMEGFGATMRSIVTDGEALEVLKDGNPIVDGEIWNNYLYAAIRTGDKVNVKLLDTKIDLVDKQYVDLNNATTNEVTVNVRNTDGTISPQQMITPDFRAKTTREQFMDALTRPTIYTIVNDELNLDAPAFSDKTSGWVIVGEADKDITATTKLKVGTRVYETIVPKTINATAGFIAREDKGKIVIETIAVNAKLKYTKKADLKEGLAIDPDTDNIIYMDSKGMIHEVVMPDYATQVEMTAGTDDKKIGTPKTIKTAVMDWIGAKFANTADAKAGTDKYSIISPKTLSDVLTKWFTDKAATPDEGKAGAITDKFVTPAVMLASVQEYIKTKISNATITDYGVVKLSTPALVKAGVDDKTAITPLALRESHANDIVTMAGAPTAQDFTSMGAAYIVDTLTGKSYVNNGGTITEAAVGSSPKEATETQLGIIERATDVESANGTAKVIPDAAQIKTLYFPKDGGYVGTGTQMYLDKNKIELKDTSWLTKMQLDSMVSKRLDIDSEITITPTRINFRQNGAYAGIGLSANSKELKFGSPLSHTAGMIYTSGFSLVDEIFLTRKDHENPDGLVRWSQIKNYVASSSIAVGVGGSGSAGTDTKVYTITTGFQRFMQNQWYTFTKPSSITAAEIWLVHINAVDSATNGSNTMIFRNLKNFGDGRWDIESAYVDATHFKLRTTSANVVIGNITLRVP